MTLVTKSLCPCNIVFILVCGPHHALPHLYPKIQLQKYQIHHTQNQKIMRAPIFLALHQFVTIDTSFASWTFNWTYPSLLKNDEINFQWFMKSWTWCRVNWPIIDHLPMTEHFDRSFSILLHFEWFEMLHECFLKLYKSSLKCKAKGPAKKEL